MLSTTRKRRNSLRALTAGLFAFGLGACGSEIAPVGVEPYSPEPAEGIPELNQPLTPLVNACAFDAVTGIMDVTVQLVETAILSKRTVDSAILVNGVACGAATTTNLRRIDVVEHATNTGNQVVVLDFLNGAFATGSASGVGLTVDMGTGTTDTFAIRGSSGIDRITVGGTGIATNTDTNNDITYTAVDAVVVTLSAGNDIFTAQGGNGTGAAYTGAITVYGGDGNDSLIGGDGIDTINGGAGNDTITGNAGNDILNGDAGDDSFTEGSAANGGDTFNGGAGTDTVDYSARTADLTVTVGAGANDGDGGATENDDVGATVEVVLGGSGDDALTGDGGDNTLTGNAGDDTLTGGAGDDTLNGGTGDDIIDELDATSGADTIICGTGIDFVDYSGRTNAVTITMASGADDGETGETDDVRSDCDNLTSGAGADSITGNNLANVIDGGAGNDTLVGGAGNDIFRQGAAADGADDISGGLGDDLVDYSNRTAVLTVTMGDATANDGLAGETDNIGSDVEWLDAGTGDDVITGNDLDNVINAGDGDDTVSGGLGDDEIFGGAGDDIALDGDEGDDTIDGGAGDDAIDCGLGEGDIGWNEGTLGSITGCEL